MIDRAKMGTGRSWLGLVGWLALVFCASATAVFIADNGWHAGLAKPTWNPPGRVFGPAWTISYSLRKMAFRQGCQLK